MQKANHFVLLVLVNQTIRSCFFFFLLSRQDLGPPYSCSGQLQHRGGKNVTADTKKITSHGPSPAKHAAAGLWEQLPWASGHLPLKYF